MRHVSWFIKEPEPSRTSSNSNSQLHPDPHPRLCKFVMLLVLAHESSTGGSSTFPQRSRLVGFAVAAFLDTASWSCPLPRPHPFSGHVCVRLGGAPASSTCRALWHILILLHPENANFSRLPPQFSSTSSSLYVCRKILILDFCGHRPT